MNPPPNTKSIETDLGTYSFDADGILICQSKSTMRTVENIRTNGEMVRNFSNGKKSCLLIYITNSGKPDKATHEFVNEQLPKMYSAMAMISKNGVAKIIMSFLFRAMPAPIPMKIFSDEKKAKEWLMGFKN